MADADLLLKPPAPAPETPRSDVVDLEAAKYMGLGVFIALIEVFECILGVPGTDITFSG